MEIPVYNSSGELVEQFNVDEAALGGKPKLELLRQALIAYEANQRVGTAKTKTRGDVKRTGHKIWRQKHTGRARHGDRGAPLFEGGGAAHGARPREYRQKMNRKARRAALESAFLAKALDREVIALDRLELPEEKTRAMARILGNLGVDMQRSFLVVMPDHDPTLWRCCRNIRHAAMTPVQDLNAYEMIRPRRVIFVLEALRRFLAAGQAEEQTADADAGVSA